MCAKMPRSPERHWTTWRHNLKNRNPGAFDPQPAGSLEGSKCERGVGAAGGDSRLRVVRDGTTWVGSASLGKQPLPAPSSMLWVPHASAGQVSPISS